MTDTRKEEPLTWAVLGSSGFVGSALSSRLRSLGHDVIEVPAPRMRTSARTVGALTAEAMAGNSAIETLAAEMAGANIVVNAAGLATPDALESDQLFGANSLLPTVIARAAQTAGAERFLQLSSAAVQGNIKVLDSRSFTQPFSPYSESKALGEQTLLASPEVGIETVVIRATSVQGPGRTTTRNLRRIARSRMASVARPGNQPSTVSSIDGLVDFVVEVGTQSTKPAEIVLQPWEGGTVSSILSLAGDGRRPTMLPAVLCKAAVQFGRVVSKAMGGRFAGTVRRVELMWFGQEQEEAARNMVDGDSEGLRKALSTNLHDAEIPVQLKVGMLTQWFDPETGPAALPGVYAREMVRAGQSVSVLTGFPNYPDGKIYPGFSQSLRNRSREGQIQVTRVPLYPNHSSSAIGRILNYLSFALSGSTLGIGALRKTDAVWVYNSPATVSLPLFVNTIFGRKPYFLHVQDLWPDSLINSGMIPGGAVGRVIEKSISSLVRLTERRAAVIGVISPSVKELILRRNPHVAASKIVYVPNPTDEELFTDVRTIDAQDLPIVPWSGKFVFMYLGAIGEAQGLDMWLDAARHLRLNSDIAFVFVGEGTAKERLHKRALAEDLDNVVFHGRIPKIDVPRYMATSSVQIVSLGADEFLRYTIPSKISSILASRLPLLAQIAGDGAELVRSSGAGLTVDPGDVAALSESIETMAHMSSSDLDAAAQSGLDYYRANMSAQSATKKILSALRDLVG